MPRAFDITASSNTVRLSPSREGEVSFTVSNALRLPMRVRAVVEPSGGTRPEWLSLPEGEEKELPPDGTAMFPVKVSVPEGASPGEYAFTLLVVSVANPDEHYARGPSVALTVPAAAPAPEKKAFPWGWVALIGGALVIIAGVVWALLPGDELPGLGQRCAEEAPRCAEGLVCTEGGLCLGGAGFSCGRGDECASGRCEDGTCRTLGGAGEACTSDRDCDEPLRCHEGACLVPDGSPCASGDECISGRCIGGTCRALVPPGGSCKSSEACEPPARCLENRCVLGLGRACEGDEQCQSGNCRRGVCERGCSPPCESGLTCVDGECRKVTVVPAVRGCDSDQDCPTAGTRCVDRGCRKEAGGSCRGDIQCISRQCVNGRCR